MKSKTFTAILSLCLLLVTTARAETIRAYHIGNSLTDNIHYGGERDIATRGGDVYKFGKHVSPGAPLDLTWAMMSKPGTQMYSQAPYGFYQNALKNYTWEVM